LHSRRLRALAVVLAVAALALAPLAWRATRGLTFAPAFPPRFAKPWPAPQGIQPQSGLILRRAEGGAALVWADLEGSVHAATVRGQAFATLLGVQATSAPLLGWDLNLDRTEDLILATQERQLLSFDGQRGTRLAASDWFAEPIYGPSVLCAAADGSHHVVVHSAAGKVARFEAQSLRVAGHETYHAGRTRAPAAAYDMDGDGEQDAIMGDEAGRLVGIHARSGDVTLIQPEVRPDLQDSLRSPRPGAIRAGICGYDYSGDGLEEWVFAAASGLVAICDGRGTVLAFGHVPAVDSSVLSRSPSPVLADLSLDAVPEIIVAHPDGSLYAFQAPGKVPGPLTVLWKAGADLAVQNEVALADLTGDGVKDVVVVTHSGVLAVLDGRDGRDVGRWAIGATGSPLIEDLNDDDLIELAVPTDSSWAILETGCPSAGGNVWPTWRGDAGRRGRIDVRRQGPAAPWWGGVGLLSLAALFLWVKS
jgi:hypothetical protein